MPNDKGFYDMQQPMKKTQPKEASAGEPCPKGPIGSKDHWNEGNSLHANYQYRTEGNINGSGIHDFNIKGKITNNSGSDYHDVARSNSGLHGNFAEKDAQLKYLTERGKQGQIIRNFNGTVEQSRLHSYNIGQTAYNSKPIDEVYRPATSHDIPPVNAVVHAFEKKTENTVPSKTQKDLTKKLS